MRRGFAAGLVLVLGFALFPFAEHGAAAGDGTEEAGDVRASENKWAVAPATGTSADIDGVLNESFWQQAALLDDFRTAYAAEAAAGEPTYRVAYDADHLYIGGVLSAGDAAALARVELLLSPSAGGGRYYAAAIEVDAASRIQTTAWSVAAGPQPVPLQRTELHAFPYALANDGAAGGRTLEAAIPFSALGVPPPASGDEWRLNIVHVYNINTRPLASWVPVRTSQLYDDAGQVRAVLTANLADEGRMGSLYFGGAGAGQPWQPEDWRLSYIGFAEKRLSFRTPDPLPASYRLEWKEENRDWIMLENVTASSEGDRTTLSFTHPEPLRAGLYQLRLLAEPAHPADGKLAIFTFDREDLVAAGLAVEGSVFPPNREAVPVNPLPASSAVQDLLDLLPAQNGFTGGGRLPTNPDAGDPSNSFVLSADGRRLLDKATGVEYPNETYPETHMLSVKNKKGETVEYPYYEDAEGRNYFFSALLWRWQTDKVLNAIPATAASDPLGAARLLHGLAVKYEGYVPNTNRTFFTYPIDPSSGPPFNWLASVLGNEVGQEAYRIKPLLDAYALVLRTDALQVLSQELGEDAERRIVESLFLPALDYALSFPVVYSNYDPYFWRLLVAAGRTLDRPDYVHRAVEWMERFVESQFMADGFWKEVTLSYHQQVADSLSQALQALRGYSDPPGYVSPRTGRRFDNLDLQADIPFLDRILRLRNEWVYPNGSALPVQDTWANMKGTPQADAESTLLPSAGIARLASGQGMSQTQLYMMFTPKQGHDHYDPLNLTLFAEGQELLPDLGYTYTRFKHFTLSGMGHNTVVVNSRDMTVSAESRLGGKLERLVTGDGLFQAVRASEAAAYPETETYSREAWLVPFAGDGEGKGYVLDLFRVRGGDRHEYTLQGDANRDAWLETEHPLHPYGPYLLPSGTAVQEPVNYLDKGSAEGLYHGYIHVRDVQQAVPEEGSYSVTLATRNADGTDQAKLRITGLLEEGSNELYLGRSPSIRATRLYGGGGGGPYDNNTEANKTDMPKLVLRRDGTGDGRLNSTFAAVMEPYRGATPRIEAVDRLPLPPGAPEGAAAVRVVYGSTTDMLLSNPLHPHQPLLVEDMELRGEMAMIRIENGVVRAMELVGGTLLKKGDLVLTGEGTITGVVSGTLHHVQGDSANGLLTALPIPATAAGRHVIITHPDQSASGYRIEEVRPEQGGTLLVLEEAGPEFAILADGTSKQLYYPGQSWEAPHTFQIPNREQMEAGGTGEATPFGTVTGTVYDHTGNVPLAAAEVRLTGYSAPLAYTDEAGRFELSQVPQGDRRLTVVKAGYARTVTDFVYVADGHAADVSVVLADKTPPSLTGTTAPAGTAYDRAIGVGIGDTLQTASTEEGELFLVPAGTLPVRASLEAAIRTVEDVVYGVRQTVAAHSPFVLDTSGFAPGRYQLYALDSFGNRSEGIAIELVPRSLTTIDGLSPFVRYTGEWSSFAHPGHVDGSAEATRRLGDYAEIPFYGKAARLIAPRNTGYGKAHIYVDGAFRATVDMAHTTLLRQQVIYETDLLPEGLHVIRIEAAEAKYVFVDAVQAMEASELSPRLSGVTAGPLLAGMPIAASSSKDGMLYLVPDATEPALSAIAAAGAGPGGRQVGVTADVYGTLDTAGLAAGLYRVYAADSLGNLSAGSAAIAIVDPAMESVDDRDAIVRYAGGWTVYEHAGHWGGTVVVNRTPGDYVEIPFYGASGVLLAPRNTNYGQARLYVDGVYRETIDLYHPSLLRQQEVFHTGPLTEGLHTLRIETVENKYAAFDALLVSSP